MKIRDAIYLLLQKTTDIVRTDWIYKPNITIAANNVATVDIALPQVQGYKLLNISNFKITTKETSGATLSSFCFVYNFYRKDDDTYTFVVRNIATSQAKICLEVSCLMIRGGINPLVSTLSALLRGWRYADKRYALCDLAENAETVLCDTVRNKRNYSDISVRLDDTSKYNSTHKSEMVVHRTNIFGNEQRGISCHYSAIERHSVCVQKHRSKKWNANNNVCYWWRSYRAISNLSIYRLSSFRHNQNHLALNRNPLGITLERGYAA